MAYNIKAITSAEMQEIINDGTFASCFTSAYSQLNHATKPTHIMSDRSDEFNTQESIFEEIKYEFTNSANKDSHRIQKIVDKSDGGVEHIIGLRVGHFGGDLYWINDDVDQSTYYWAHIELIRNDRAGSKSWYYDSQYLSLEASFYQSLGVTKWHCLMMADTDYTDAITAQAIIRTDDDPFKTPTWSDIDIIHNDYTKMVAFNTIVPHGLEVDLSLFQDTDITYSWKKLEYNI